MTYQDVDQAAAAITQAGTEPTVDRVREHLGTGSKSTIAPLLKRWRQQRDEHSNSDGLPAELLQALKLVYAQAQALAEQKIEQIEADTQQQLQTMQEELAQAVALQQQTSLENTQQQEQIERLKAERKQLSQTLEQQTLKLVKSDATLDETRQQLVECRATIAELRQENRDIRDHFEHYQQQMASDRQQEREQFRFSLQQLEDRQQDLQQQLNAASTKNNQLDTLNISQAQQLEQQSLAMSRLKQALAEASRAQREADIHLEHSRTAIADLQQQNDTLQASLTANNQQLTTSQHEQQRLSLLLDNATQAAADNRTECDRLAEENRQLAEAKAISLGQIRQLEAQLAGIQAR
ncbi:MULTISPECIES: DNA-binding protein [unclassified Oceanobacter]|uniref:DNA-binding protein n=1 Tax=unclassified Oceanobacter TaxID=2620260 RepID=UPI0027351AD6|nr:MULTISPECIES: DNA-binding protein [unclassified Oceanobacter]MDP2608540.1 DNA-binding protein [Oceanobacter sp. 1_MG-2023]MDP2611698.1 DNA-binding protein [Oceanobacter sp. 2_MG-2023]